MKRIVGFVVLISVLLSTISVFAQESVLPHEVRLLSDFKIMNGDAKGNYNLNNKLTRAEAVAMVCRMAGIEPTHDTVSVFSDVEESFWAAGYINAAYKIGIVNGYGDTMFKPNEYVTYTEATKMLVIALGYKIKAESIGGYPHGYVQTSIQIGIGDQMAVATTDPVSRLDMVNLVYNCLDIPLMKQTSFGADAEYAIMDGTKDNTLETFRIIHEAKDKIKLKFVE